MRYVVILGHGEQLYLAEQRIAYYFVLVWHQVKFLYRMKNLRAKREQNVENFQNFQLRKLGSAIQLERRATQTLWHEADMAQTLNRSATWKRRGTGQWESVSSRDLLIFRVEHDWEDPISDEDPLYLQHGVDAADLYPGEDTFLVLAHRGRVVGSSRDSSAGLANLQMFGDRVLAAIDAAIDQITQEGV